MRQCKREVLPAAVLLSLMVVAGHAHAFTGKVTYPDGSPAVGATVNVVIQDNNDTVGPPAPPQQQLGRTSQSPTVPPQYTNKSRASTTCDSNGRFSFPSEPFAQAMLQIKSGDAKDYATVTLPVKVFEQGEVVVTLHPTK